MCACVLKNNNFARSTTLKWYHTLPSQNNMIRVITVIKWHQNVSQGTVMKEDMRPHVIEIKVTTSKITSDPSWRPKKTSKTKNPQIFHTWDKCTSPECPWMVVPLHFLVSWLLLQELFVNCFCNFLTTVACYLVTVTLLLILCLLWVSHLLVHLLLKAR